VYVEPFLADRRYELCRLQRRANRHRGVAKRLGLRRPALQSVYGSRTQCRFCSSQYRLGHLWVCRHCALQGGEAAAIRESADGSVPVAGLPSARLSAAKLPSTRRRESVGAPVVDTSIEHFAPAASTRAAARRFGTPARSARVTMSRVGAPGRAK
jgi:hypothetical protein